MQSIERVSIELTNRCDKGCWFCYNDSRSEGQTAWTVDELVDFVMDCQHHGTAAVSFGGGEPLQFDGLFELLRRLDGVLFRSITTNGLLLNQNLRELVRAKPDKVHISIHCPHHAREVRRVADQVTRLADSGIASGVNLLVAANRLEATKEAAATLRAAGIGNDRIVYLPLRGTSPPSPRQVAKVAGNEPFQSMSCLGGCGRSERFCSVSWDKQVAWCSYTASRQPLRELNHGSMIDALQDLPLVYCGGPLDTHEHQSLSRMPSRMKNPTS